MAVRSNESGVGKFVRGRTVECDGIRADRVVVQFRRECGDQAAVDSSGEQHPDRLAIRQSSRGRVLEQLTQPADVVACRPVVVDFPGLPVGFFGYRPVLAQADAPAGEHFVDAPKKGFATRKVRECEE